MTTQGAILRAPSYFVLAALLDGPLHGYVIIKRVSALSEDSVRLAAGTLYAILDRLTDAALIEVVREEVVNGRARRYYALTAQGRDMVRAEAERLAAAATIVTNQASRQRILGIPGMSPA